MSKKITFKDSNSDYVQLDTNCFNAYQNMFPTNCYSELGITNLDDFKGGISFVLSNEVSNAPFSDCMVIACSYNSFGRYQIAFDCNSTGCKYRVRWGSWGEWVTIR